MDQQNPDNWFKGLPRPGMPGWVNRGPMGPPGPPGYPGAPNGGMPGGPSRMRRMVAMRPNRRKRFGKREIVVILVVLLLVVGTLGVLIKQSIDSAGGDDQNGGSSKGQQAYDAVKAQADQYSNSGDYAAEAKALEDYLKANPTDQVNAGEAQMRLAAAYTNAQQYDQAFSTYQLLNSTQDPVYHRAGLHGLGTISALKGNKGAAVQYLSQLIQEYESSGDSPRQLESTKAELAQIQGQSQ